MPETNGGPEMLPGKESIGQFSYGLNGVDLRMDTILSNSMWVVVITLILLVFVFRMLQLLNERSRLLFAVHSPDNTKYWKTDKTSYYPWLKKNFLYAPLNHKRHNREIQLSSAVNVGTIPSRFHSVLLGSYLVCNMIYMCILNYKGRPQAAVLAELRGRSGHLSLVNMVPLIVLAGRNNPLIPFLRVSYDTFNLLHRWLGRLVVLQALIHTACWAANTTQAHGTSGANHALEKSRFLGWGMVGMVAMSIILIQSPSCLRHAFYEVFLHCHQLLALIVIISVWIHCQIGTLPGQIYIYLCAGAWALDRFFRFFRLVYHNYSRSKGLTSIRVEALPGAGDQALQAIRLTVSCPRPWKYVPGTHAYIYIPSLSFWMNHPFSVAWSSTRYPPIPLSPFEPKSPISPTGSFESDLEKYKLPPPSGPGESTDLHFVIAKRTGMTAALYRKAAAQPNGILTITGFLEGPYGGNDNLTSYGTVILFAGGIGITHQIGHIRHLLHGHETGTTATKKIVLVWSVKNTETLEWIRPWMDEILKLPNRREVLKVILFVTRPRSPQEVKSRSERVLLYPGRCVPLTVLESEIRTRVGAVAVTVCGPGAFGDEVRDGVRHVLARRTDGGKGATVDFIEEAFSW